MLAAAACAVAVFCATSGASAQGLIRDAEIEATLREYSEPIFAAAGLAPKDVDIYVVNDPTLNAFAGGGQNVFLHTGLIMASDNVEQLKGVIAHETGHIAEAHSITRSMAQRSSMGTALVSIGLGVLAIAAGAPDAGAALLGSSSQFATLSFFQYTQNEESAADQVAITYLEKTGQSADGLVQFFEKYRIQEALSTRRRDPYFRSHPISSDRIGQIRARASEVTARAQPQSERALRQMEMMKAKLIGFLGTPARVYNKYPKSDLSVPARYARAIAAYRAIDIGLAEKEILDLIGMEPENPYFHELYGQILFENARVEESIAPHRRALELAPDQPLLFVNLARSLLATEDPANYKEAEGLLIDALARERDNAFAWNQLAQAYGKLGRTAEAQLATAEEAYAIGDYQRAFIFSKRASDGLEPNSPNARRASDIAVVTDPRVRPGRRAG
ncbi:M48 family metalloprotease [bacterium]|nr:M48 family metalloprotease [bacterium]